MRSLLLRVTCTALVLSMVLVTNTFQIDDAPSASADHHGETVWDLGKPNTPRIGLIGDSSFAAVRWRNIYGDLTDYNFVYNAESCRRTIATSCRGREGYPPANAFETLRIHSGQWGRVLVMVTGYNDPGTRFGDGVDAIVREAKRQGINKVMWLTMRTADVSYEAPDYQSDSYTFRDNNRILLQKAVQYRGYLQIADWATYSADNPAWVGDDGIHLTASGTHAVTTFISNQVRKVLNGQTITPAPNASGHRSWSPLRQGDYGSRVVSLQRGLMNAGISLYGGADGQFGSYTREAVERYQRREGLRVTEVVYERMAIKLGIYNPPPPTIAKPRCKLMATMKPDDRLFDVLCLKRHLAAEGSDIHLPSRHYGPKVGDAVHYYKSVRGLNADRVAGPAMLKELSAWKQRPSKPACRVMATLKPGDKLADVRCMKQHLRARGFRQPGGADFGGNTRLTVRHIRRNTGMTVHGVAGPRFLQKIRAWGDRPVKPACRVMATLKPGDKLVDVHCMKLHLRARGFRLPSGTNFGRDTRFAVRHIRGNTDMNVHGVAGPKFLREIRAWGDRPAKPDCLISHQLEPGYSSPAVRCLKKHLRARGFNQPPGPHFGNYTKLAVRHIKANQGLPHDGIAGHRFLKLLRAWDYGAQTTAAPSPAETESTSATVEAESTTTSPTTVKPALTTQPPTAPSTTPPTAPPPTSATSEPAVDETDAERSSTTSVPPTTSAPATTGAPTASDAPPAAEAAPTTDEPPPGDDTSQS